MFDNQDTHAEHGKFIEDAQKLTDDIFSDNGAMGHVRHLLNVWAVFVPSNVVRKMSLTILQGSR